VDPTVEVGGTGDRAGEEHADERAIRHRTATLCSRAARIGGMSPRAELTTERLIVRSSRRQDAAEVAAALDEVVLRAHGWSDDIKKSFIELIEGSEMQHTLLVVCDRSSERVVGTLHMSPVMPVGVGIGSIGVMLGPEGRGRGFAAEALRVALPYFHSLGVEVLLIETDVDNSAMRRSAEAAGATLKEHYDHQLPDGRRVPAVRYVHLPQDPVH
jgi:RimJ/RimL family protein N-acetyltransferase